MILFENVSLDFSFLQKCYSSVAFTLILLQKRERKVENRNNYLLIV